MTAHQHDPAEVQPATTTQKYTMNARLDLFGNQVAARFSRHIFSAGNVLADSTLPAATQELVKIRASQINGCGFCVDMYAKDAAHAGETSARLSLVAVWREATVFTEAERAALELRSRAPASLMRPVVSRTRPGRMPPSTTTKTSSRPWCASSPSSTPSTAGSSWFSRPPTTSSPARSDNEEQLPGAAGAIRHQQQHMPWSLLAGARGVFWSARRIQSGRRYADSGACDTAIKSIWPGLQLPLRDNTLHPSTTMPLGSGQLWSSG